MIPVSLLSISLCKSWIYKCMLAQVTLYRFRSPHLYSKHFANRTIFPGSRESFVRTDIYYSLKFNKVIRPGDKILTHQNIGNIHRITLDLRNDRSQTCNSHNCTGKYYEKISRKHPGSSPGFTECCNYTVLVSRP